MASTQSVRQAAPRAAFQMQQKRRGEQARRAHRLTAISIKLIVALRDRDDAETRARNAIRALEAEGLDQTGIVRWSYGELDAKEAARLRDASGAISGSGLLRSRPRSRRPDTEKRRRKSSDRICAPDARHRAAGVRQSNRACNSRRLS